MISAWMHVSRITQEQLSRKNFPIAQVLLQAKPKYLHRRAWMPRSCDVHGCTNAAKAWMPRSGHVGTVASGDLDHLKMITYLVRMV